MTIVNQDEDDLLVEVCNKHGVNPQYLRELFTIEKEYADKNMSKRRGIYDRITELIDALVEEEEAGINVL